MDAPASSGEFQRRIDSSHSGDAAPPQGGETLPQAMQRLRVHSSQLTDALIERQHELNRRESQLEALSATLTKQERAARLASQERRRELRELSEEIERRNEELLRRKEDDAHSAALAADDDELEGRREALNQKAAQLAGREEELEAKRAAIEELASQLRARQEELDEARAEVEAQRRAATQLRAANHAAQAQPNAEILRKQRLLAEREAGLVRRELAAAAAESLLEIRNGELDQRRRYVEEQHDRLQERTRAERAEFDRLRQETQRAVARGKADLAKRGEELDAQSTALAETRRDVAESHRETLELQLATETIWSEVQSCVSAAGAVEALARTRRKIADYYRGEQRRLEIERSDLQSIAQRIRRRFSDLERSKVELQQWLDKRREAVETDAGRLTQVESELERRRRDLEEAELALAREREAWQAKTQSVLRGVAA